MCPAQIQLCYGDILKAKADVCICSIHRSRDMKLFPVSHHILRKAGATVQKQLNEKQCKIEELGMGQVEMTEAGDLKSFKKLLFICLKSYIKGNEKFLLKSLIKCLEIAAKDKHTIVAVPALATGGLNYPPEEVAKATLEAVALHNLNHGRTTTIKTVKVVLFDDDIDLIRTYVMVCNAGSTNLNDLYRTRESRLSQRPSPGVTLATAPPDETCYTDTTQECKPPQATGTTQSAAPSTWFLSFIRYLAKGWKQRLGIFTITVWPFFDRKTVGLTVSAAVDNPFRAHFI